MVVSLLFGGLVTTSGGVTTSAAPIVGAGFEVDLADLNFILGQIKIAENHVDSIGPGTSLCEGLLGDGPNQIPEVRLPFGLRTVDGTCNHLEDGTETFGAADTIFPRMGTADFRDAQPLTFDPDGPGPANVGDPTTYNSLSGIVSDADPRLISNLIVDQTPNNPAAIAASGGCLPADMDGANCPIGNTAPDAGLSAPFNSMFTFFGQFFDHGLDLVNKGGAGTVFVALQPDDALYNPDLDGPDNIPGNGDDAFNFLTLSRATNIDGNLEHDNNQTTSYVDQNQTYTSHPSHQVFLRGYENIDVVGDTFGVIPVSTGEVLDGAIEGNIANWAEVKAQAASVLGIQLEDTDVGNVPLLATDPYGQFIRGPLRGMPMVSFNDGATLVEGNAAAPISVVGSDKTDHAFLDDIAHNAAPSARGAALAPDVDTDVNPIFDGNGQPALRPNGQYDDELLDAHFITGDGRGNENIGLTAVHTVFHSEHNRLAEEINADIQALPATHPLRVGFETYNPASGWAYGDRLFQAARFVTEMQYQHLVFEEFARTMAPSINVFIGDGINFQSQVNPAITAEFAHAVYRFGHSMLTESVRRTNPETGATYDMTLFEGFLNPTAFNDNPTSATPWTASEAAGVIFQGASREVGNEIDEFVTEVLRNQLLGRPLDLATLNLARGRSEGLPSLNVLRQELFNTFGHSSLRPYGSWDEFGVALRNEPSLVNFVAAYGTHPLVQAETTVERRRAAGNAIVNGVPFAGALTNPGDPDGLGDNPATIGFDESLDDDRGPDNVAGTGCGTSAATLACADNGAGADDVKGNPDFDESADDDLGLDGLAGTDCGTNASTECADNGDGPDDVKGNPDFDESADDDLGLDGLAGTDCGTNASTECADNGDGLDDLFGTDCDSATPSPECADNDLGPDGLAGTDCGTGTASIECADNGTGAEGIFGNQPDLIDESLDDDDGPDGLAGTDCGTGTASIECADNGTGAEGIFGNLTDPVDESLDDDNGPDNNPGANCGNAGATAACADNGAGAETFIGDDPSTGLNEALDDIMPPADAGDFINGEGFWSTNETGLNLIDLWMGGLAEAPAPFGGLLGSTFNWVFELQLENLQNADRFYYLERLDGLNLLAQLEGNSFAELVMRNTTARAFSGVIFSRPGFVFELNGANPNRVVNQPNTPENESTMVQYISGNRVRYTGGEHIIWDGSEIRDNIISSEGDDTFWGNGGDDRIEGGSGNDQPLGGEGDDIITDVFGDDVMKGGPGNDVITGGPGLDLLQGNGDDDFIVAGNDFTESFGGAGDDIMFTGDSATEAFAGAGDDWMEGGGQLDLLVGDENNQFQDDPFGGHDVIIGGPGDDDYDSEGGDDVMVADVLGTERLEGMLGFDWVTYRGDARPVDADMRIPLALPPQVIELRDRFDKTEALSGYDKDDKLRGDDRGCTPADQAAGVCLDILAEGTVVNNELSQAGIDRVNGLRTFLAEAEADVPSAAADPNFLWDDGNILLGGAGNDELEGRGANDIIDGDRWLNVQLSAGTGLYNSLKQFQAQVVSGAINPGTIDIVRTIAPSAGLPGDCGTIAAVNCDIATFTGTPAEYLFAQDGLATIVTHQPTPGTIGPDGIDSLLNIEQYKFLNNTPTDFTDDIVIDPNAVADFSVDPDPTLDFGIRAVDAARIQRTVTVTNDGADASPVDVTSIVLVYDAAVDHPPSPFNIDQDNCTGAAPLAVGGTCTIVVSFGAVTQPPPPAPPGADAYSATLTVNIAGGLPSTIDVIGEAVDNTPAAGAPVISDTSPTETIAITADTAGITDVDGTTNAVFSFQWNTVASGPIAGATSATFTPTAAQVNQQLTVTASFTDDAGSTETVTSAPTTVVGRVVNGLGTPELITGTAGDDILNGNGGNDTINGGGGNDVINGGAGVDTITGAGGIDTINGDGGNDTLNAEAGADIVNGGAGNDILNGGTGNDVLNGGTGDDIINADAGTDTILFSANSGLDDIRGGAGTDTASPTANNVTISTLNFSLAVNSVEVFDGTGFTGFTIAGTAAANTLNFGGGVTLTNVVVDGLAGDDNITGSAGNDIIIGGAGNDTMNGGAGFDTFRNLVAFSTPPGRDTINGFDANPAGGGQDVIQIPAAVPLAGGVSFPAAGGGSTDVTVVAPAAGVARIVGVGPAQLTRINATTVG